MIHPTAIISPDAALQSGVSVDAFSIIDRDVTIGEDSSIAANVRIEPFTTLGKRCKIFHGAVIGGIPQDLKFNGEPSELIIGDDTAVREYAVIHRGTAATGKTVIGKNCLIMNYVHVAHDCVIGNHVILSNAVNMAGHVIIEDFAGIGGMVPVHQFIRIGQHAFVGGGYRIAQDVPPYVLAAGEPLRYAGLNYVGLRRRNFSEEQIRSIEKAYHILYREKLNRATALTRIKEAMSLTPEIESIINFFEKSERGVIR
ncbi:acyl-ACP--UDP-N-acetylglucosamine O-acyltransferase [bacterium]|nr:acyl-ACP--UDP-N-acetylglucosamine O-acyltransferase [bacterium]